MRPAVSRVVVVVVIIIILLAATVGVYTIFLTQGKPTQTTSTTGGNAVPNPSVFVEENTIQPGPGGLDPALTWDYSDMFFLNVYENLMLLSIDAEAAARLPKPGDTPASYAPSAGATLKRAGRRAMRRISRR